MNAAEQRGDEVDALAWTIRLTLGHHGDVQNGPRDWAAVLRLARLERCVGLAWLRSGRTLRAGAPPVVAAAWRHEAARLDDAARRQFAALVSVVRALEEHALNPIVLKGAPLSQLLYDDPFVRHSADLDLYLPASEIDRAEQLLRTMGWANQGRAHGERVLRGHAQGIDVILELHESLTDDSLIAHIALPPVLATRMEVNGVSLPVMPRWVLPVYLAAHLAKHTSAPVLWLVDFATLWGALDDAERAVAKAFAGGARAARVLDWALARVSHLERAARGERAALRQCGGGSALFREPHALRVTMATAPNVMTALRLWTRWTAARVRTLGLAPENRLGRLRRVEALAARLRRANSTTTTSVEMPRRTMRIDAAESTALLRDVIANGASTWVVARGASMSPSIASGSRVRVAPFGAEGPCPGDVAVVESDAGEIVMHRIVAVDQGRVQLRGDNMDAADRPLERVRLIGRATHLEASNGPRPIARQTPSAMRRHLWRLRRRAERLLRAQADTASELV